MLTGYTPLGAGILLVIGTLFCLLTVGPTIARAWRRHRMTRVVQAELRQRQHLNAVVGPVSDRWRAEHTYTFGKHPDR
jgi:hypothetical protein